MREKNKDKARLLHIIEAIDNIFEFTNNKTFETYRQNKMLRFAIIKNLEIIGEAAYLLTNEFKKEYSEIEWHALIGMRHVLVHGYYQIRDEIVWATIETDFPPLREKVQLILKTL